MVKLAEYNRTATFAWSHDKIPYLASGTASGTMDADFSNDSILELWSLLSTSSDKPVCSIKTDAKFNDLDWSFDNKFIAGALDNGAIELFSMNDSKTTVSSVTKLLKHTSPVNTLRFNPKQTNLLLSAGSNNNELYIWDVNQCSTPSTASSYTPTSPGTAMSSMDEIKSVAWNRNNTRVFATAGANNPYASIWDLKVQKEVLHLNYTSETTGSKPLLSVVEWHPVSSTTIATASGSDTDPVIVTWDLRNANQPLKVMNTGLGKGILSLDWCAQDSGLMLSSGRDNTAQLWNPEEGKLLSQFPTRTNWCFKTKFAPAVPDIFASASFDAKIQVQTLQNLENTFDKEETQQKIKESESEFWNNVSNEEPSQNQKPTVLELQTPKWYEHQSPAANWAFGGKLVQILPDGKGVSISKPTIQGLEPNEVLNDALKTKDFVPLINVRLVKTVNKTNEEDWTLLEKLSMDGKEEFLKDAFSFDDNNEVEASGEKNNDEDEKFFNKLETDFTPSGQFKLKEGKESNISKDLIKGNLDSAITKCLDDDMLLEALVIALDSTDATMKEIVKNTYFTKYANKSSLSRVMYSTQRKDIEDMINNLDIQQWRYTVKAIYNYFKTEESKRNELLVKLGDKLVEKNMRQDALIIFFAANSLDKVSSIWLKEFKSMEDSLKEQNKTVYEAHSECLTEFIEKFTVLSSFLGGNLDINSEELISKFMEFVNLTSASGNFDLAAAFLENLPGDNQEVNAEKQRVQIASGKQTRTVTSRTQQSKGRTTAYTNPQVTNQVPQQAARYGIQPQQQQQQQQMPQTTPVPQQTNYGVQSQMPTNVAYGQATMNQAIPTGRYAPVTPATVAGGNNQMAQAPQSSFLQPQNPYAPSATATGAHNQYTPQQPELAPPPQTMNGVRSGQTPHLNRKANDGWNDLPLKVEKDKARAKAVSIAPPPMMQGSHNSSPHTTNNGMPPPPLSRVTSSASVGAPPSMGRNSRKPSQVALSNTDSSTPPPPLPKIPSNPYAPKVTENAPPVNIAPPMMGQPPQSNFQPKANPYAPPANSAPASNIGVYGPSQTSTPHMGFVQPPQSNINAAGVPPQNAYSPQQNPYAPPQNANLQQQQQPMSSFVAPPPMNRGMDSSVSHTPMQQPVGPPPMNPRKKNHDNGTVENASNLLNSIANSAPSIAGAPAANAPVPSAPPISQAAAPVAASEPAVMPEEYKSIVEFLQAELKRVTPLIPQTYTKQLKDCDKRLNILFGHLQKGDLLTAPTIEKLKELIEFLKVKNYEEAKKVHVDIATNHAHEGGNWLTGVKRLIGIAEATSS
ncbi:similar to Saccharomyces cerevisiae YDL195W SEC31 Component of the Sec13p-Sec31p complex of the COPII vesicle coat, required for vesicle formation in ER to Golgi transport [Maudiozyma barnettii]|uniref:Protein transport protein SEC31 n=1 Tax=Maudiozyma barnettii TaxID=61262 RepID=A0A8H2VF33_9SACH|nr:Sec31p [Kazachstania barnettii]CAB4253978.1 similar to Saccharomyces cerevisiae YDL195W SEC31 Component of the Sec13p-Sec31p complex of the COPII vesicle coat, required for vesicle formation in ER to Golgi transport [Kazachstania barnettii]CAD1781728.1 similar to Saccharomyces cerevisiae YDL195W SEC31 Component of the Sec13p-Sec31p complex of the COPII vesicle coat, required for vesicle formation in ER to Golgi transport [Kazachstania barnettii]